MIKIENGLLKLSEELKNAIIVAQSYAKEYSNPSFYPAHLLKGLLHKNSGLREELFAMDIDVYYMEEWAEVRMESYPKDTKLSNPIPADDGVENIFQEAEELNLLTDQSELTSLSVLTALTTPGVGFTFDQLKTFPLQRDQLLNKFTTKNKTNTSKSSESKTKDEFEYLTNLTLLAKNDQLSAVVARDQELLNITETIGRFTKPHILITGESGVGKSVIVNGLATIISKGKVPDLLTQSKVFKLQMENILAGATYKGEIEDRLRKVFKQLEQLNRPILFLDDLQTLIDDKSGNAGITHLLKSELNKGYFVLIATIPNDSFRKLIDGDSALKRLFEHVNIEEPDHTHAIEMTSSAVSQLQNHHKLTIHLDQIAEAVTLASRHFSERKLPDSAIDLIDRTMAGTRAQMDTLPSEIDQLEKQLEATDFESSDIHIIDAGLRKFLTYIGQTQDEQNDLIEPVANCRNMIDLLRHEIANQSDEINFHNLATTVARVSGIPVGKIMTRERDRLLGMEDTLKSTVIGQDQAVTAVCESILESRSGLNRPGQPIGSFFFLGPTGTGKTELGKQLANFLFQSSASLIRFDMSEFKEEHSAALLYGAPPGYVGYEEGGMLVNKIRQEPYSVVLFDEIEKAHPSVFDIFLQILDEGTIHDRLGKTGDFSNAVILFTSNIGSQSIVDQFNEKQTLPASDKLMESMAKYFRPEFLGRLTGIVPFAPISKGNITKIFNLQLRELTEALEQQEIELEINNKTREKLAAEGYSPQYGARPLRNIIRTRLRTPLSRMIIGNELKSGQKVTASFSKNNTLKLKVK
ncbi:AAA family ATPase [Ancylomarina sp. 16SWW S1-10-2]|uniref:AAA family ATPase n=1 Tax=Ancylomarina sp. 16SWW S1-10-2 TaxID=2499681 RepID=UPI0012ADCAC1|nr:ATP-dependent Clp protease ATP-binding subunit [Ancylomarina sp. 16SWW S1-10-2]MRT94775.1 ATP-dependent Clp protease ATP-binding subunit [Ancylomarina sp. 16SWW S1-10-2]